MRISFWIPTIACVMYIVRVDTDSVQVGTVLFTTTDLVKKCWSESDKSLLRARLIMQDVLPDPNCVDFTKSDAILILLDYFHACYDIISTSTYGKMQNLMFLAMSDALGGYLRTFVLPLARQAYYAGHVKYSDARRLFQLYNDIKEFLKTNGVGWADPQNPCGGKFPVRPLVIPNSKGDSSCKKLYTIEVRGNLRCISTKTSTKDSLVESFQEEGEDQDDLSEALCGGKKKFDTPKPIPISSDNNTVTCVNLLENLSETVLKNDSSPLEIEEKENEKEKEKEKNKNKDKDKDKDKNKNSTEEGDTDKRRTIIPLPVLDDSSTPHTIAVPFKKRPLRNLQMPSSAFILERYYSTVIKCLVSKKNTRNEIQNFNNQFYTWLVGQVFPHLNDEDWYPGFGGVLRITDAIKKFGVETSGREEGANDIGFMFSNGYTFDNRENAKKRPRRLEGNPKYPEPAQKKMGNYRNFKSENAQSTEGDLKKDQRLPYHSKRHFMIAIIILSGACVFTFSGCLFYFLAIKCRNAGIGSGMDKSSLSRSSSYGGRSERPEIRADKRLNFSFLIRFFRNPDPDGTIEEEPDGKLADQRSYEEKHQYGRKSWVTGWTIFGKKKQQKEKSNWVKTVPEKILDEAQKEKERLAKGQGDAPPFIMEGAHSHWPCDPSLIRFEEVESCVLNHPSGDAKAERVETLWEKPQGHLNRITAPKEFKGDEKSTRRKTGKTRKIVRTVSDSTLQDGKRSYVTEPKTSTCYSEGSSATQTTTTNSSSQTQVEEKLSSATTEYFDKARKRRCKEYRYKKHSTQESTEETESDEEDEEEDEDEDEEEEEEEEEGSYSSRSGY